MKLSLGYTGETRQYKITRTHALGKAQFRTVSSTGVPGVNLIAENREYPERSSRVSISFTRAELLSLLEATTLT